VGVLKKYRFITSGFVCLALISLPLTFSSLKLELIFILIFAGGLSNTVGVADIADAAFKNYNNKYTRWILVGQLFILSWTLGVDTWYLLRNIKNSDFIRVCISAAIVLIVFAIVASKKPTSIIYGLVFFMFLVVVSLYIFPDILDFARTYIDKFLLKLFRSNFIFVKLRLLSYLHLLIIPLVYLIPDIINKKVIDKAIELIKLDGVLLLTGIIIWSLGIVAKNRLFEAGGCAAILVFSNLYYAFLQNKTDPIS